MGIVTVQHIDTPNLRKEKKNGSLAINTKLVQQGQSYISGTTGKTEELSFCHTPQHNMADLSCFAVILNLIRVLQCGDKVSVLL